MTYKYQLCARTDGAAIRHIGAAFEALGAATQALASSAYEEGIETSDHAAVPVVLEAVETLRVALGMVADGPTAERPARTNTDVEQSLGDALRALRNLYDAGAKPGETFVYNQAYANARGAAIEVLNDEEA